MDELKHLSGGYNVCCRYCIFPVGKKTLRKRGKKRFRAQLRRDLQWMS